jgi:hypothetical protein
MKKENGKDEGNGKIKGEYDIFCDICNRYMYLAVMYHIPLCNLYHFVACCFLFTVHCSTKEYLISVQTVPDTASHTSEGECKW